MDKLFHPTYFCGCNYLSMLGLKLTHVSTRGYWSYSNPENVFVSWRVSSCLMLKISLTRAIKSSLIEQTLINWGGFFAIKGFVVSFFNQQYPGLCGLVSLSWGYNAVFWIKSIFNTLYPSPDVHVNCIVIRYCGNIWLPIVVTTDAIASDEQGHFIMLLSGISYCLFHPLFTLTYHMGTKI